MTRNAMILGGMNDCARNELNRLSYRMQKATIAWGEDSTTAVSQTKQRALRP